MSTRPHLARERQHGMLVQAHQRLIRQFRDLASARRCGGLRRAARSRTHPEGRDPDAR
jgi:hypothetical protein